MDLLVEDICALDWSSPVIAATKKVTQFLMNHDLFRADMKERGITLTQPGESRFFTNFLMMQELVKCKAVVQAVIIAPRAVLYQKNLKKLADKNNFKD